MNKSFILKGKRDLIFTKERDEFYDVFDPLDLTDYKVDEIAAEILYCVSKNFNLDKMVQLLTEEYDISGKECEEDVIDFLENCPLQSIFYTNLMQSGIYLQLSPFKS